MKNNRNRRGFVQILLLVAVTICFVVMMNSFFAAENLTETSSEQAEEQNLIQVGFSQLGSESVWRSTHTDSIKNALSKANGYFLQFDNARQKQENQIKAIRGFISQRVDYIVMAPLMEDGWETVLEEAKDAGVPVIIVDRSISEDCEDLYTAWIGSDSRAEGESAGEWLEDFTEEKGITEEDTVNIAILEGTIGSSAQIGRSKGFAMVAARHANWNILTEVGAEFTTAKAIEVTKNILNQYHDIDVLVCQNDDMAFGAIQVMEEQGISVGPDGDVQIISFDASKKALEMVQEGKISVDVECNPLQGEYVDEILKKLEAGEEVPKKTYVEEQVFTRENVGDYIEDRQY